MKRSKAGDYLTLKILSMFIVWDYIKTSRLIFKIGNVDEIERKM